MKIEQIYTNCLAEAAYYIESNGEAAIIDPLRETRPYLDLIEENKVSLKYIFETHFHADFVSGHVDLAKETGATIVYGPSATTNYPVHVAKDKEVFKIGEITIEVIHTPGHTFESSTYLLRNKDGEIHCIFSGDTLFIGDVGRPDLAIKSDYSRKDLAALLFDSLRNKIMPLPDTTIVYPAHGAGSACGKNLSEERFDTLGNQKKTNYALRADMTKEEFVTEVLDGLADAPQYFAKNAAMNKNGYNNIEEVLEQGTKEIDLAQFKDMIAQDDVLILDTRTEQEFIKAHVPNSLFIGIVGGFAPWVGTLIEDINQKIVLVSPVGKEVETVIRLARVGYDNCIGYLEGGFATWLNAGENIATIPSIDAKAFEKMNPTNVVDVRKQGEWNASHLVNATLLPLDNINKNHKEYSKEKDNFIHCEGGYRSVIACSILKQQGIENIINVEGGFSKIKECNLDFTEPTPCSL
jgi:glyoxylase-like metal-dependent hydrolase (beta-lactamase superfamily II)/rhodanese-related sulfurtransferase